MKKIVTLTLACILIMGIFIGCSKEYVRDTSKGEVVEIKLDEALEKANSNEEFVVVFTVTTCKDCTKLKAVLGPYLENHGVKIHEVVLDKEGTSQEEIQANRNKINTFFPNFNATPSMYYVKDGKIIDEIIEVKEEEKLDEWIVKNKIDDKK